MSRGVGNLQRHILDRLALGGGGLELRRGWGGTNEVRPLVDFLAGRSYVSSYELAHSIRDAEPTRSERSSVQRAIRNLQARGLVEVLSSEGIHVRLPVSDEQREAEWLEVQRNRAAHVPPLSPLVNWP